MVTLAQSMAHYNNPINKGVAQDIIEVSDFLAMVPFQPIAGNAFVHKFEKDLGGAAYNEVGAVIPEAAKTVATIDKITYELVSVIAEATVDNFVQATGVAAGHDNVAYQIASKAKRIGQLHNQALVAAAQVENGLNSLDGLTISSQELDRATQAVTLDGVRELLDGVKSKGGAVDFMMGGRVMRRKLLQLADAAGGNTAAYVTGGVMGSERKFLTIDGVLFLLNDHVDESAALPLWAGNWDDGSKTIGLSMLYAAGSDAGLGVEAVGTSQTSDAKIFRVKQYAQSALFNRKGLAKATFQK